MTPQIEVKREMKFDEFWECLGGCYNSLVLRCVARKNQDTWKNLFITGFLSRRSVDEVREELRQEYQQLVKLKVTEIEELGIFFDVFDSQDIPAVIKQMEEEGQITLQNSVIELYNKERKRKGYFYHSSHTLKFGEYSEYPVISYVAGRSDSVQVDREIEDKLLSLGFRKRIDEIATIWLKMPGIRGYALSWIVTIPVYFNILEENMEDGSKLRINFKAHNALKPTLGVLIALRRNMGGEWVPIENARLSSEELSCMKGTEDDFLICEANYSFNTLPSQKDRVYWSVSNDVGLLSHNEAEVPQLIGKREFEDVFLNTFAQFITLDDLEKILKGEKFKELRSNRSKEFQRAVVYLLSLIGFRSIELGDVKKQVYRVVREISGVDKGDVDIIAEDIDTKTVYVIDCKLNPPEARDIDVTANIARNLRGRGIMVEALIIVGDSATESKRNVRRVKIIDRDDLLKVIQKLREGDIKQAKEIVTSPPV